MKRLSIVVLAAAGVLAVAGLATLLLRPPKAAAVVVQQAPLVRTLEFAARVASASRVDVGATVTGRVARVAVQEGATVKAGQVLVQLELDELDAALAQAEAGERQAAARLAGLRSTGRGAAQAGLAQADSVLQAARADLKRTRELIQQGFVSAARLDEADRAVAVAEAQRAAAEQQVRANADPGTDIAQAQAQQAQAAAATAAARARRVQATLLAPADAQVLARHVEPGQIVQPGRALLVLALASPLELVAQVDERHLEQLRTGQTAAVLADAFPTRRFAARVRSIAPLVDAQRGAVEVKFTPEPPLPDFLREDMTLSVAVETGRRERTRVLPISALRGDAPAGDAGLVYVARDGRVEARRLKLGLRTLDAVEVLDGLADGEPVLIGAAPEPGRRVRAEPGPAPSLRGGATREDAGTALMSTMGR